MRYCSIYTLRSEAVEQSVSHAFNLDKLFVSENLLVHHVPVVKIDYVFLAQDAPCTYCFEATRRLGQNYLAAILTHARIFNVHVGRVGAHTYLIHWQTSFRVLRNLFWSRLYIYTEEIYEEQPFLW